jgi:hypothetical protein
MRWRRASWLGRVRLWSSVIMSAGALGCATTQRARPSLREAQWTFDEQKSRQGATGWKIAATNPTAALATWQVVNDPAAPSPPDVFALTRTDNYDGTFNLAIADGATFRDLELSVKVKAVAGKEDQGGGPIWRCQDENNYYICRLNPLEANFRVYVVANGKRRQLDSVKLELSADRWYEIHVRMVGNQITCYLDGEQKLTATDDTITIAGRVGLWTKADAVTSFDDVRVRAVAPQE